MRYNLKEPAYMVGYLEKTGLTDAVISIVELGTLNSVALATNECIEIKQMPGWYVFSSENIADNTLTDYSNLFLLMSSESAGTSDVAKWVKGKIDDSQLTVDLTEIKTALTEINSNMKRLLLEVV